jgi:galactitol-specific phosphotransferase system IIB component
MTYRFNNMKIRTYLRYQEKNFDKEKMMVTVMKTMEKWRKLFISQAHVGE